MSSFSSTKHGACFLNPYFTHTNWHQFQVEVKTTKNTERRVQRCIVLEDGRIIEHDDPHIVVDTVEDTQTHEFDHLEDESLARELQASIEKSYQQAGIPIHEASNRHRRRPNESRRKSLGYDKLHRNKNGHGQDSMKSERDMISEDQVVRQDYTEEEATSGGSIVNDTFKRVVNTHDVRGTLNDKKTQNGFLYLGSKIPTAVLN
jgi:hypothetical protein